MTEAWLFAGPSTYGLPPDSAARAGVRCLPPARRGDVARLVDEVAQPGTILLCDGVFHVTPAVSHAELCRALDRGWQVWGVSSLGAIRAHELRDVGMRGYGKVYAMFAQHEDFTDDEMCLLHCPEAPYFPVTEALVNLRYALAARGPELGIRPAAAQVVIDALRQVWFGDRSPELIREVMVGVAGFEASVADTLLAWLPGHRVKTLDLNDLLVERPWCLAARE